MKSRLGRYEILSLIARGGMAEVWLAEAKGVVGFSKKVVLKTILPHLSEHPDFVKMFINEALLAARLNHPHIVQIFDLGNIDDRYYIAMEYVAGRSLRQIARNCKSNGKLVPPWFLLLLVSMVCDGLQYAHDLRDDEGKALGLVHRDVTPENIMVSFVGNVKILDFGIAKASTAASLTEAGLLKGKYAYISPEQVQGAKADRRSDIYALGVILYEFLTGNRPFRGSNDLDLLRQVADGDIKPPRKVAPWIHKDLEEIVMSALARDLDKRYTDAAQLGLDILAFLQNSQLLVGQRDLALFLSSLFPDEPGIPTDVLKTLNGRTHYTPSRTPTPRHRVSAGSTNDIDSDGLLDITIEVVEGQQPVGVTKKIPKASGRPSPADRVTTQPGGNPGAFSVTGLDEWALEEGKIPTPTEEASVLDIAAGEVKRQPPRRTGATPPKPEAKQASPAARGAQMPRPKTAAPQASATPARKEYQAPKTKKPEAPATTAKPAASAKVALPRPKTTARKTVRPEPAPEPDRKKPRERAKEAPAKAETAKPAPSGESPAKGPGAPSGKKPADGSRPGDKLASIWDTAYARKTAPGEVSEPVPEAAATADPATDFWTTATSKPPPADSETAADSAPASAYSSSSPPPAESGVDVFDVKKPKKSRGDDDVFTSFKTFRLEREKSGTLPAEELDAGPARRRRDDTLTEFPWVKRPEENRTTFGNREESRAAEHFDKGMAYLKEKKYDDALAEWEVAVQLEPENRIYQSNLKRLKEKMGGSGGGPS